jgi:voltage-dependent potassium channel beta subunit
VRYRKLGRWGLRVSEISLGSWLTFGTAVDDDRAARIVRRALDLGVNLFDTANVYGQGRAEEVLGRALAGVDRSSYVVATKVFGEMGPGPNDRGLARKHVVEQCDASLRRLGVERIDLYQCHRDDPEVPLEELCRTMDDLIRWGKVLYWGVSEWEPARIEDAVRLCEREGLHPPVSDQPRYSMLERGIEEAVLPTCRALGLGAIVFSPLAQGVLTGKYRRRGEIPPGSRAARQATRGFVQRFLTPEILARVERLRAVAAEAGLTLGQLALAWVLRRPEVASAIVGATDPRQLEENVGASGWSWGRTSWPGSRPPWPEGRYPARWIRPAFRQLAQTFTRRGVPSTMARTRCTFGSHRRFVRRWEWDTRIPKNGRFPQMSQTAAMAPRC